MHASSDPRLTAIKSMSLAWLIGRVLVVFALLPNGLRKIHTFDVTSAMMGGAPPVMIDGRLFPAQEPLFHFPFPEIFLTGAILFDLLGALLVIVGYRTRPAAGVLAAYCLLAMAIYHSDITGPQDLIAVLRNLPLIGGLLILAAVGAGPLSLDAGSAKR